MSPDSETRQPPYSAPQGGEKRQTAVAIKRESTPGGKSLSRVVAKGQGTVAEQILALAFATGVKVREDADLAEILHAIEVDTEVPLHALAAVAEILSYVYRANAEEGGAAASESSTQLPENLISPEVLP